MACAFFIFIVSSKIGSNKYGETGQFKPCKAVVRMEIWNFFLTGKMGEADIHGGRQLISCSIFSLVPNAFAPVRY